VDTRAASEGGGRSEGCLYGEGMKRFVLRKKESLGGAHQIPRRGDSLRARRVPPTIT